MVNWTGGTLGSNELRVGPVKDTDAPECGGRTLDYTFSDDYDGLLYIYPFILEVR